MSDEPNPELRAINQVTRARYTAITEALFAIEPALDAAASQGRITSRAEILTLELAKRGYFVRSI